MGFVFRLEKVARYRQQLVDEQGRKVAAAERGVAVVRAQLAALEQDLQQCLQDMHDPAGGGVSVQALMARTAWMEHLDAMREDLLVDLQAAKTELNEERARLNAVWRDLEVLNKLRSKQKADWEAEQTRRENRDLDEIGQLRADRQRRSKVAS